jgi:hypothetical protein
VPVCLTPNALLVEEFCAVAHAEEVNPVADAKFLKPRLVWLHAVRLVNEPL